MNQLLARDFQASEIAQAIKQMHPRTTPGLDGLPPLFYQRFLPLTSNCVTQDALDFLNHGIVPFIFMAPILSLFLKFNILGKSLNTDLLAYVMWPTK